MGLTRADERACCAAHAGEISDRIGRPRLRVAELGSGTGRKTPLFSCSKPLREKTGNTFSTIRSTFFVPRPLARLPPGSWMTSQTVHPPGRNRTSPGIAWRATPTSRRAWGADLRTVLSRKYDRELRTPMARFAFPGRICAGASSPVRPCCSLARIW